MGDTPTIFPNTTPNEFSEFLDRLHLYRRRPPKTVYLPVGGPILRAFLWVTVAQPIVVLLAVACDVLPVWYFWISVVMAGHAAYALMPIKTLVEDNRPLPPPIPRSQLTGQALRFRQWLEESPRPMNKEQLIASMTPKPPVCRWVYEGDFLTRGFLYFVVFQVALGSVMMRVDPVQYGVDPEASVVFVVFAVLCLYALLPKWKRPPTVQR